MNRVQGRSPGRGTFAVKLIGVYPGDRDLFGSHKLGEKSYISSEGGGVCHVQCSKLIIEISEDLTRQIKSGAGHAKGG